MRGRGPSTGIIRYTAPGGWKGWSARRAAAAELGGFDCAILLPNSFDAALLAWMARIPVRIGYRRDGRGLAADGCRARRPSRARFRATSASTTWNCCAAPGFWTSIRRPRASGSTAWRRRARRGGHGLRGEGLEGPVVGVSPGAAFGGAKRWPAERFTAAAPRGGA